LTLAEAPAARAEKGIPPIPTFPAFEAERTTDEPMLRKYNTAAAAWQTSLSATEVEAMDTWARAWQVIRRDLAAPVPGPKALAFMQATGRAPTVTGLVYRGIAPGDVGEELAKYRGAVGTTVTWDVPTSVSLVPKTGAEFGRIVFEIKSKTARYIDHALPQHATEKSEHEAIVMPGTRYRVSAVSPQGVQTEFTGDSVTTIGKTIPRWVVQLEEI